MSTTPPTPSAGDIWSWDYEAGTDFSTVLILGHVYGDCWDCYNLTYGEFSEWWFGEDDMSRWTRLA